MRSPSFFECRFCRSVLCGSWRVVEVIATITSAACAATAPSTRVNNAMTATRRTVTAARRPARRRARRARAATAWSTWRPRPATTATRPRASAAARPASSRGLTCTGTPSHCTMTPTPTDGTCALPNVIALAGTGTLTGTGSGDTTSATNQVPQARCDSYSMDDRANDQIWTFTTTDVRDVTITLEAAASGDDSVQWLTTIPCDQGSSVSATPTDDGCIDAEAAAHGDVMTQAALTAGTYYVVVDGYNTADVGPYTLTVSAAPSTCGDGTVDPLETCDDHNHAAADGCNARCQVAAG